MEKEKKTGRLSSRKKAELVLELLRGKSIEELSRTNKVAVHQLTGWHETFVKAGTEGFKKAPVKGREAKH